MKKIIIAIAVLFPLLSLSQRLHLDLFGGFTNYQGDLQEKPYTFEQANGAFGAGLKYDINGHFFLRSGFMYGKVKADDKRNKASLQLRNLNFQTKILEGNMMLEYNIFDLDIQRFTPYVFAGAAVYHYNPYSYDTLGVKTFLKPLSTEGQGLPEYKDRNPYKLTQFAIPFGGGLKLRLTDNVVIGYEIGLRKLSTDYLDDVSKSYADKDLLLAAKGFKSVEMAYKGDEVKNGNPNYPDAGTVRGSAKQKDWYYFQGINISIGITGMQDKWKPGRKNLGCPQRVL